MNPTLHRTQLLPWRRIVVFSVVVTAAVLSVLVMGAPARGAASDPGGCDPHEPTTCSLADLADRLGMRIGSTAEHFEVTPGPYAETLAQEFNAVTPENALKMYSTQANRGVWTFDHADAVVDFADANGLEVRGHALVWSQDQYPPQWIKDITDPEELRGVLAEHIETVMGRYQDRIHRWDVVNEPLAALGTGPADSVIVRLLGPGTGWIAEQFATAHAVDPDAELWINEFGTDLIPGKHEALLELVGSLVDDGVPIHGVGLQMHRFTVDGPEPEVLRQHLEDFAALGLEVAITELDVVTQPNDPLAFERQAEAYGRIVAACLEVAACNEVTTWNLSDADSWLDRLFGFPTRPTLFDDTFTPKPAYHTVRQLLAAQVQVSTLPRLTGTVTGPGGDPVEGAWIMGYGPGDTWLGSWWASTDSNGFYELEVSEPGPVQIMARPLAPSVMNWQWFGGGTSRASATPVDAVFGEHIGSLDISLPASGLVTGTVVDSLGDPVSGAVLSAYGPSSVWVGVTSTATGADGTFHVGGLSEVEYRLRVVPPPSSGLVVTWFDGASRRSDASWVTVTAGEPTDVTVTLLSAPD